MQFSEAAMKAAGEAVTKATLLRFWPHLGDLQAGAWAEVICELQPREVQGFPSSGFGYTPQEIIAACKRVSAALERKDQLVLKRVLDALRESRDRMHTFAATRNRREVKAQLTSNTESTRQRNAHYAGRLSRAIKAGDFGACARIAEEASKK